MGKPRFTEEFKIDAIKQITERGYSVADVSRRLGVSTHSLYGWMKRYSVPPGSNAKKDGEHRGRPRSKKGDWSDEVGKDGTLIAYTELNKRVRDALDRLSKNWRESNF